MKRGLAAPLVGLALLWPGEVLAYRPFDSTDAAVADKGMWEIELESVGWRHDDNGAQWVAPALIANYGFADDSISRTATPAKVAGPMSRCGRV